jgi:hypothetical protein
MIFPFELSSRIFINLSLIDFFQLKFVSQYFDQLINLIKYTDQVKISCDDISGDMINIVNVNLTHPKKEAGRDYISPFDRINHVETLNISQLYWGFDDIIFHSEDLKI